MPNIPLPPCQDGSPVTDADLAALLAGKRDAALRLQPVADVLAALTAEPSPGELAGEARALAEFRQQNGAPVPRRGAHRGAAKRAPRLGTKVTVAATGMAVLVGGATTAAFANMLPAPIQRLAHDAIGAPYEPSPQHGPARGKPAPPVPLASHGTVTQGAKTRSPGRHSKPHPAGTPAASPHGQDQQGSGQGQGQQGSGQSQEPQGDDQGQANPDPQGRPGDPHPAGLLGNPHASARPAARHAPHRPPMNP